MRLDVKQPVDDAAADLEVLDTDTEVPPLLERAGADPPALCEFVLCEVLVGLLGLVHDIFLARTRRAYRPLPLAYRCEEMCRSTTDMYVDVGVRCVTSVARNPLFFRGRNRES